MNVLITGGAGFIGSHLAERYVKDGCDVTVIDDLSTGSLQNIAAVSKEKRFSCTVDSILNSVLVNKLVERATIVFHLAAAVGVRLVLQNPIRSIETNVGGTQVVLRAAARWNKRVIVASSSEVYGKGAIIPFREDADLVMGPTTMGRWSYACAKMLDEFLALAYVAESHLPVTVVRFFNTAGPRQTGRYGMVLPEFVKQALLGKPLTVFGTGEQQRCFGYVADVVESLVRIARSPDTAAEVINIGNDREVSIYRLAELVKEITHSTSRIVRTPYEQAYGPGYEDVLRRVPSLEKLQRLIGYRPATSVEDIIFSVSADMTRSLAGPLAA